MLIWGALNRLSVGPRFGPLRVDILATFYHIRVSHTHFLVDRRVRIRMESCIRHALILLILIRVSSIVVYLTNMGSVHHLVLLG